ncbi:fibronectin type III domain-containing protein [Sphingobacterium bambusae]|uniref:Fibronectin type-III domain-containing protein n=1 Tax=Sphingobacterium bambusae TaxID=662858 RepID=A0ABW6BJ89_9SPHI|nr:hypothetical protein [Sphingobacterium bambusae]WPL49896.1 hypothetical protein SCB77_05435 [Sphingobacterium bambusae]
MLKNIIIASILAFSLGMQGCSKSEESNSLEIPEEPSENIAVPQLGQLTFSDITTTGAQVVGHVSHRGGAFVLERGVCWSKEEMPTVDNNYREATSAKGSGEFGLQLTGLVQSTSYYVRAYAKNKGGIAYGQQMILRTADIQSVDFAPKPLFIIGSSRASYDVEIVSSGGGAITERGICWGTTENPTVADHKIAHGSTGIGKFRANLTGLTERTNYHLRAYAVNETGVSYGTNVPFRTIGKGNVTYTFNKASNPNAEQLAAYDRLQVAIDSAVWYANNYTSATKHVWLNYDAGVPTADANNEGWMRFGANASYQNIRTMLHEMNHTFGTGTTSWWSNQAISGGKYQFAQVNTVLKLITADNNAVLNGDGMHWWPYGLNQNSEVTSSWDFVYNCLIIEAMRRDGMTSHSGSYQP